MESVPGAVATGSQLAHDPGSRSRDPVATAPGTDLILKLRHYRSAWPFVASGEHPLTWCDSTPLSYPGISNQ
jgi:hypothetical protein